MDGRRDAEGEQQRTGVGERDGHPRDDRQQEGARRRRRSGADGGGGGDRGPIGACRTPRRKPDGVVGGYPAGPIGPKCTQTKDQFGLRVILSDQKCSSHSVYLGGGTVMCDIWIPSMYMPIRCCYRIL